MGHFGVPFFLLDLVGSAISVADGLTPSVITFDVDRR
jgi:hypothetical protein